MRGVTQRSRLRFMHGLLAVICLAIMVRLIDLSILQRHFLVAQSRARILREPPIVARRGIIYDRYHQPLAISVPVQAVWVDPSSFPMKKVAYQRLANTVNLPFKRLKHRIVSHKAREFVYIKRRVTDEVAKRIKALHIPGLYLRAEYKRFYPQGRLMSHLVGSTNIDERGQEGVELRYNNWLRGVPGRKTVIRDRLGRTVANLRVNRAAKHGHHVQLAVDTRIQYAAADALHEAVTKNNAESGSIVVLDAQNGELLAMANYPDFDPNTHHGSMSDRRNRAITDVFEPGSTMKPFTVVSALESGKYNRKSVIHTSPGWMRVGRFTIHDEVNFGDVTLRRLLKKSSNIGAAKIMLSLDPKMYWQQLGVFGFGERTHSNLPGEMAGRLLPRDRWLPSEVATMAYGYGISVTALQLAHAYGMLASGGINYPVSSVKLSSDPQGTRVIPKRIAQQVTDMLSAVLEKGGTGKRARVPGYRAAGKTGTANIATPSGYDKNKVISSFVGYAPLEKPRFVVAVVIRNPQGRHFGALVAAPAFSKVMTASLRAWGVHPDGLG